MKKVLIIDDEAKVVTSIAALLKNNNYEVLGANDAIEGFKVAKEQKPDLIILDILMPGMDGSTLAANLKATPQTKDIPLIFLTGLASGLENTKRGSGTNILVAKPFEAQELLKIIAKNII